MKVPRFIYYKKHRLINPKRGPYEPTCEAESKRGWLCCKAPRHRGPHVAACCDSKGNIDEVVAVWKRKR